MPRFELELDDKGDFVGALPTEIDAILKRIEATAHGKGYGTGVAKAAEDAKKQIEDTVRTRIAEFEARQPLEKERYAGIEAENATLKTQLTDRIRESDRAMRTREEAHAEELTKRVEALKKRDERIQGLVRQQIRGLAVEAGARDESLDELEVILGASLGFDDDMEVFVKGSDGQPLTQHGKAVSLAGFVKSYIDSHPHHRRSASARGTDTRGGAFRSTMTQQSTQSLDQAKARIDQGDRSPAAINDLFLAGRKKSA